MQGLAREERVTLCTGHCTVRLTHGALGFTKGEAAARRPVWLIRAPRAAPCSDPRGLLPTLSSPPQEAPQPTGAGGCPHTTAVPAEPGGGPRPARRVPVPWAEAGGLCGVHGGGFAFTGDAPTRRISVTGTHRRVRCGVPAAVVSAPRPAAPHSASHVSGVALLLCGRLLPSLGQLRSSGCRPSPDETGAPWQEAPPSLIAV